MGRSVVIRFPSKNVSTELYYLDRAANFTEQTPASLAWQFDDFPAGLSGWTSELSGTGSSVLSATENQGVLSVTTGATAGSLADYCRGAIAGNFPHWVTAGSTGVWYIACRLKLSTAVDAQATLGAGLRNGAATIGMCLGINGSVSTANWSLIGESGSIDSGVAHQTSTYVTLEAYRNPGGTTYVYVNESNVASGDCYPTSGSHAFKYFGRNGTTATTRTYLLDWVACAAKRG